MCVYVGPWGLCWGDCFNASRSRTVVCIKNDGFAEESECDLKEKPATFEDCQPEDMKDCRPKWHYSDWSEVNFMFLIKTYVAKNNYISVFNNKIVLKEVRKWNTKTNIKVLGDG